MEPLLDSENPPPVLDIADKSQLSTMDRQRPQIIALPTPGRGIGGLFAIIGVYLFSAVLYVVGYAIYSATTNGSEDGVDTISEVLMEHVLSLNGIAGLYTVQFICLMPLLLYVSKFKQQKISTTLALKPTPFRTIGFWLGVWGAFTALGYLIDLFLEIPDNDIMLLLNGSKHLPVSLVIVLLAPILEEAIFRGYLFKAWRHSWLGLYGTILVTSLLFTLIHAGQYDIITLLHLFVLAIVLGLARERTGSLLAPIAIHAINNLLSAVLVIYMGIL